MSESIEERNAVSKRWRATLAEVGNNFSFHPATDVTGPRHDEVRMKCKELALYLADHLPPGRHQSLALTSLETTMHWANAAIACDSGQQVSMVEIGGQTMTEAQFNAARFPLLNPDPGPTVSA